MSVTVALGFVELNTALVDNRATNTDPEQDGRQLQAAKALELVEPDTTLVMGSDKGAVEMSAIEDPRHMSTDLTRTIKRFGLLETDTALVDTG